MHTHIYIKVILRNQAHTGYIAQLKNRCKNTVQKEGVNFTSCYISKQTNVAGVTNMLKTPRMQKRQGQPEAAVV